MNTSTLNYSFIAVPTNLFFALDNNLRNALTVLLQLSSVFADADGYFFRTNEDLKADFKMGKNLTIAVLESLYRYGLLQVKSVGFTKKNGKKQVNFYRVNVDAFKNYEKYHIYTITKNEELHLDTVDYKAKDFKVTYTASTVNSNEESISEPTEPSNNVSEEIPSKEVENVSEGQETSNTEVEDIDDDCPLTQDELQEHEEWVKTPIEKRMMEWKEPEDDLAFLDDKEDEEKIAESATESVKVDNSKPAVEEKSYENNTFRLGTDGKRIETASVIPTDLGNVEKRFIHKNIDQDEIGKCYDLCNRFCKMDFPNAITCNDYCNKACDYYYKQYTNGKIDESDYKRLLSVTTKKRWEKFPNVC